MSKLVPARLRPLNPDPKNPTLENNGADVHHETDFRSVYTRVFNGSWASTRSRCSAATSGRRG